MPRATDEQVQQYADQRLRPRAEQIRALLAALQDDKRLIDDVYEHVSGANNVPATWADARTDAPPHLLTKDDVLAYNAYITALLAPMGEAAEFATVMKACVRPPAV